MVQDLACYMVQDLAKTNQPWALNTVNHGISQCCCGGMHRHGSIIKQGSLGALESLGFWWRLTTAH